MPYYKPILSPTIRLIRRHLLPLVYRGKGVTCPICSGSFRCYVKSEFGLCPGCGAPGRSRLLWVYLHNHRPDLISGSKTVLQIAPDLSLEPRLRSMKDIRYLSGDLYEPEAMIRLDLTNLELPDQSFDLVICLHVLAHISNDRRAMREIFRVLRRGGVALIMTPMKTDTQTTYEDPTIIDPKERDRAYGEWDFVRVYGLDFLDRLMHSGFEVETARPADQLGEGSRKTLGVWNDRIFVCHRPAIGS